jgi:hypothetical protein
MTDLYLHEIFPVEILDMMWAELPFRTRATATRAGVVEHYGRLIPSIPRFQHYVLKLIRKSDHTAFLFELLLKSKSGCWSWFGSRWKDQAGSGETYTNYISFLADCCRRMDRPKCILVIQKLETESSNERGNSMILFSPSAHRKTNPTE